MRDRTKFIFNNTTLTNSTASLDVSGSVNAHHFIDTNKGGIYSHTKDIPSGSLTDFFSIEATSGAHAFTAHFVCNTSGYSVSKIYNVARQFGQDAIYNIAVDTGEYAGKDFSVEFSQSLHKLTCKINNGAAVTAPIASTIFIGGSVTDIIFTKL